MQKKQTQVFTADTIVKKKTYAYVINNEEQASAIFRNMEYHFPKKLDVEKNERSCNILYWRA